MYSAAQRRSDHHRTKLCTNRDALFLRRSDLFGTPTGNGGTGAMLDAMANEDMNGNAMWVGHDILGGVSSS